MALTNFGIREKWLRLLLKVLPSNPCIFSNLTNTDNMEEAQYLLGGMGNKQVPAVKDWGVGIGLIENDSASNYILTPFGKLITKYDPQLEEYGTYWAIHYNLCVNSYKSKHTDKADDIWSYSKYSNTFKAGIFSRNDLKACLKEYKNAGKEYSDSTIEKMCLAPLLDTMSNTKLGDELGILSIADEAKGIYERRHPSDSTLHPSILAYMLYDWASFNSRLSINTAEFFNYGSVACLLSMEEQQFNTYLNKIQDRYAKKILWVSWTAGLNSVAFEQNISPLSILQSYYLEHQSGKDPHESLSQAVEL